LPASNYTLTFRSDGYETNTTTVTVAANHKYPFTPDLKALAGFVELTSDPFGVEIRDQSDRLVGVTSTNDGSARLPLAPGTYDLKAKFGELHAVERRGVKIAAGKSIQIAEPFNLDYGTVVIASVQPADIQSTVTIQRSNRLVRVGEPILQVPNELAAYRVEARGYQPITTNLAVATRQKFLVPLELHRLTVPIKLSSEPPGAEFYLNGRKLNSSEQELPWGSAEFVARYRRLGVRTNNVEIKLGEANTIEPFTFQYGTVVLTNVPEGSVVKDGAEEVALQPGTLDGLRFAYEPPGDHRYELYDNGRSVETNVTQLAANSRTLVAFTYKPEFKNGIGMALVKIPNLFGAASDGWVGKCEVTQDQYQKIMGTNPSKWKDGGGDCPVETVSWVQAMDFCQKLSAAETHPPPGPGGRYMLPTYAQWKIFSQGSDKDSAVWGVPHPAPVGSKPASKFGLRDVFGNVREWLNEPGRDHAEDDRMLIGGGFRRGFQGTANFETQIELGKDSVFDDTGFRVIWVPK
jgi:hypothetical protein